MNTELTKSQLCRWIFTHYIAPHRNKLIIATFCMVFAAIANATNAWLMQPVMDEIFVNKNKDLLILIPLAVLAIAIGKGTATYFYTVIMKIMSQRVATDLQNNLFAHLLHLDLHDLRKDSSGAIIANFANDIQIIRRNLTHILVGFARETIMLIALLGVMCYQSLELAAFFLVFSIAVFPIIRLGRRINKLSRKSQERFGDLTSQLDDTLQGIRIVKAYNNEAHEIKKTTSIIEHIYDIFCKAARTESLSSPIMESLGGVTIALVIWYGGSQVLDGTTSPGAFFSFMTALLMAYKPLKSLTNLNNIVQETLAAVKRVHDIFMVEASIKNNSPQKTLKIAHSPHITIDQLSFSYGNNIPALENISLDVEFGRTIALVGHSGGGKSTLLNMLLRFYDPIDGKILLDNTDITNLPIAHLREHISFVDQETTLFDDTIRANIAYGRLDASDEEIIQAAKKASAHDFILELSEGYDSQVGQRGNKLSGGQRQRIALARAFLRNTPILLLDEATSALDSISERNIQNALKALMQNRTTFVIAHRLSTVINADLICVLDNGKIIEKGTHEELLNNNAPLYTTLFRTQFKNDQ